MEAVSLDPRARALLDGDAQELAVALTQLLRIVDAAKEYRRGVSAFVSGPQSRAHGASLDAALAAYLERHP